MKKFNVKQYLLTTTLKKSYMSAYKESINLLLELITQTLKAQDVEKNQVVLDLLQQLKELIIGDK